MSFECIESIWLSMWINVLKECHITKIENFILSNIEKQMVPCKSTAGEVSFEWSHHRILSTYSKVRTTLHVSIIDYRSEGLRVEL